MLDFPHTRQGAVLGAKPVFLQADPTNFRHISINMPTYHLFTRHFLLRFASANGRRKSDRDP